jgi:hypothetical protein
MAKYFNVPICVASGHKVLKKRQIYRESTVSPSDHRQSYAENPTSYISWRMTGPDQFFTTKMNAT